MAVDIEPMLARAVGAIPEPDAVDGGLLYEPKWDGFRGIVSWDGTDVEIGSRGARPLTRYFPELAAAFRELLPAPCVLDGEIVVPTGAEGEVRLDWVALSQRIHPAESRVARLAEETPAMFVAFDLLGRDGEPWLERPFAARRAGLEGLLGSVPHPIHVTRTTRDVGLARRWFAEFEGAGLDGVMAKPLTHPYRPGARAMFKVKHERTADVVLLGYRTHTSGQGVGSLLVGLYRDGRLWNVGGISAFSNTRRLELIDELDSVVERDEHGDVVTGETARSRFSSAKDAAFVRLRPERVIEVRYDQMEGDRFRHTVQFERWRPDRDPESCTFAQLEVPVRYDLADVLER